MNTKLYLGIAIRIFIFFIIWMFATYIPDYLRDFFNDVYIYPDKDGQFDVYWQWGFRHRIYSFMVFFLFLLSLVNVIMSIFKLILKYDKERAM